jgi:hypothetical protein
MSKVSAMIRIISNNEFIGRMTTDNKTRVIVIGAYLLFLSDKDSKNRDCFILGQ